MAVDDLRMLVRFEHELQRRAAEKNEPLTIVMMPIKNAAVEEIAVGMRLDEEALQAIHPAKVHVAVHPLVVIGHPQVAVRLGQPPDAVISHAVILGEYDLDSVAADAQFFCQAVHDVRQATDLGGGRALWRGHYDKHQD